MRGSQKSQFDRYATMRLGYTPMHIRSEARENNLMADTTVATTDNGPFWVSGNFAICDAEGNEWTIEGDAYLCRCGASADKPFCDGSHNSGGFEDSCRAGT